MAGARTSPLLARDVPSQPVQLVEETLFERGSAKEFAAMFTILHNPRNKYNEGSPGL